MCLYLFIFRVASLKKTIPNYLLCPTVSCTSERRRPQVDFQEMRLGLKRLETDPPTNFTAADFDAYVVRRGFAHQNGEVRRIPTLTMLVCLSFVGVFSAHSRTHVHTLTHACMRSERCSPVQ